MDWRRKVVSEEQISEHVRLRTTDLVTGETDEKLVGFLYEVSSSSERDVVFHIDISESENLKLGHGTLVEKCSVKAGSSFSPVARVEVVDASKPWSLRCRYTWTEKQSTVEEVAEGIKLITSDIWTKGRSITSIDFALQVTLNKQILFNMNFEGSENLELVTGGLEVKRVIGPHDTGNVALLQVVNPQLPWSLRCKYSWSEGVGATTMPAIDKPERRDLAPGLVLRTVRSTAGNGDVFKYELATSKNVVVDFVLDCSESTNMALKGGETIARTVVQPWDRAEVGLVSVVNPTKPWKLKCKFTWSERSPKPPGFASTDETQHEFTSGVDNHEFGSSSSSSSSSSSASSIAEHVSSIGIDTPVTEIHRSGDPISVESSTSHARLSSSGDDEQMALRMSKLNIKAAGEAPSRPTPAAPTRPEPTVSSSFATPSVQNSETRPNYQQQNHSPIKPSQEPIRPSLVDPPETHAPTSVSKPMSPPPGMTGRDVAREVVGMPKVAPRKSFSGEAVGPAIHISIPSKPPAAEEEDVGADSMMDSKEISPNVFLTTYQIIGTRTSIVYKLDVRKPSRVAFHADFSGSQNLALRDASKGTPLQRHTIVEPYRKTTVAHLSVEDVSPGKPWSLRFQYSFEEHEVVISSGQHDVHSDEKHASPRTAHDQLERFLSDLGLPELFPKFETEQIDWALLVDMAQNEDSLRSTLKELGIAKLGHREKIITSLRKHKKQT